LHEVASAQQFVQQTISASAWPLRLFFVRAAPA